MTEIIGTKELMAMIHVKDVRTVHRLVLTGQLPKPVLSTGKIKRWRTIDIETHLARRAARG
jgi:predicted DNA-binding transcriptional regulator AlpA